jgi:1-deoxy-D-xylulose-5-phosphate reductoisomerase
MRTLSILGATGSIGRSTLDLAARHPDRFKVLALTAARDVEGMLGLCREYRPALAVMSDIGAAETLAAAIRAEGLLTEVAAGEAGLTAAATAADTVVAGIVGAAGLAPVLAAARAGRRILLANKEALVCAGELLLAAVRAGGATLLPIDSEHNAIFQCLPESHTRPPQGVRRLWLTASGGPFRGWSAEQLEGVSVEQAVAHPNWRMGPKISVDSATLMNKGLEVIEAHHLFGLTADAIRVLIHPQSTIHSLVEYADGSFLAQLGTADMRIPIAHALAWPERIESGAPVLDLAALARLDFAEPDTTAFPCLRLAYAALEAGRTAPAVLNAANEVAVAAFLNGRLRFPAIADVVNETLQRLGLSSATTLDAVLAADAEARALAGQLLDRGIAA